LAQALYSRSSPTLVCSASVLMVAMIRTQVVGLYLLAMAAVAAADGPSSSSQLRGSAAAPAEVSTTSPQANAQDDMLLLTQCKCSKVGCDCGDATLESSSEEDQEVQQVVMNQTRDLHAFWEANGGLTEQMDCSCESGSSQCSCELVGEPGDSEAIAQGNSVPLGNETSLLKDHEQALSLWWAGRGGWVGGGGGWRRPWRRGWGCRRGGFGGCRCGGGWGCRCGVVRGGRCWR